MASASAPPSPPSKYKAWIHGWAPQEFKVKWDLDTVDGADVMDYVRVKAREDGYAIVPFVLRAGTTAAAPLVDTKKTVVATPGVALNFFVEFTEGACVGCVCGHERGVAV